MCGIVGFVGKGNALAAVVAGLRALEYRGYDSAGVAWQSDGCLRIARTAGRVEDLAAVLPPAAAAACAIGHTRWATHGAPSERNAHPHCDASGRIAVVHNGIIENYASLRRELEADGVRFASDTDTEAVAHLVGRAYRGDLAAAVAEILPKLDGTYALAIMAADEPQLIVAARRGSPLAVGIGDGCYLLASDAVPLLAHTRRVIFLEDGQMAVLTPQKARFFASGREITPACQTIAWSAEAAQKGGYDHFMLKEIYEQPAVLEGLIRRRVRLPEDSALPPQIALEEADLGLDFFRRITRIVLIGQGTAYHACMIGRNMLERVTRLPAYAEYAADFRYRDPILDPSVLVIAVTQSGET
ncbi:MAG: isomerizing glutamine--fructose-6-phosphate transaminase, partial [Planctomycetota bacterium]|nr:isomerizing glutamine--fructose-6-phosphate transaminase [Planctomycetota bacterium]